MKGRDEQRAAVLEKVADYLLAHGIQGASLRPMAAAAGTSDRMLLYYFADKDELMAAAMGRIAERLQAVLDAARGEPMPYDDLLPHLAGLLRMPAMRPYVVIWIEMIALAGRGDETLGAIARRIGDGYLQWISDALAVEREEDRLRQASLLFVTLEGLALFDAMGHDAIVTEALKSVRQV